MWLQFALTSLLKKNLIKKIKFLHFRVGYLLTFPMCPRARQQSYKACSQILTLRSAYLHRAHTYKLNFLLNWVICIFKFYLNILNRLVEQLFFAAQLQSVFGCITSSGWPTVRENYDMSFCDNTFQDCSSAISFTVCRWCEYNIVIVISSFFYIAMIPNIHYVLVLT